jgi:hypothetical protein
MKVRIGRGGKYELLVKVLGGLFKKVIIVILERSIFMLKVKSEVTNENLETIINKLKEGYTVGLYTNQIIIKYNQNKGLIVVNKEGELLSDNQFLIKELLLKTDSDAVNDFINKLENAIDCYPYHRTSLKDFKLVECDMCKNLYDSLYFINHEDKQDIFACGCDILTVNEKYLDSVNICEKCFIENKPKTLILEMLKHLFIKHPY